MKQIKKNDEWDYLMIGNDRLHCGDVLRVMVAEGQKGQVYETQLEMGQDWYFVGMDDIDVVGCFAKLV